MQRGSISLHRGHRTLPEVSALFRKSKRFREWKGFAKNRRMAIGVDSSAPFKEPHFSPSELAQLWGVSAEKIRIVFRKEPGVLRLPSGRAGNGKRGYITMKIPESVAMRVHRRLSAIPQ